MKGDVPHVLLINPWIHDFAAYDFWARPHGLLILAAILRDHGFRVSYIDCLDRFHPLATTLDPTSRYGRGTYRKQRIPSPPGLENINRRFRRYGIEPQWLRGDLRALDKPDLILVTSLMTYWYTGVLETAACIREVFKDTPLVLGGVYATLCREHATAGPFSRVIDGPGEAAVLAIAAEYTGFDIPPRFVPDDLDTLPYPAFDIQTRIPYVTLLTGRGCPYNCAYCASRSLNPAFQRRSPDAVVEEIVYWNRKFDVTDFAFYDDALLIDAERHALPIFEGVIRSGITVRFHTPNALHIREIHQPTADLMHRAGFKTIRLGLETADFERRGLLDAKVTRHEFERAAACLKCAGFTAGDIGAYLLAGLPGQDFRSLAESIRFVRDAGITPLPTYYAPVPGSAMWPDAVKTSAYPLEQDPVYSNNALLPCVNGGFSWAYRSAVRKLTRGEPAGNFEPDFFRSLP